MAVRKQLWHPDETRQKIKTSQLSAFRRMVHLVVLKMHHGNRVANGVDDSERVRIAHRGAAGRRLTYRIPDQV